MATGCSGPRRTLYLVRLKAIIHHASRGIKEEQAEIIHYAARGIKERQAEIIHHAARGIKEEQPEIIHHSSPPDSGGSNNSGHTIFWTVRDA
jgi:hypothetical protein